MSRAVEEAARSAKSAHDAKLASGEEVFAARVRLLAATLLAAAPGLDALAHRLQLFALEVFAVDLASRALPRATRGRHRERLFLTAPVSVSDLASSQLCAAVYDEADRDAALPYGRLVSWRPVTCAEAVKLFGEGQGVERLASELLHRLKRAGEGNNLRRAREWTEKAARLEALALLLEHESRSAK